MCRLYLTLQYYKLRHMHTKAYTYVVPSETNHLRY
jgi:hypothetical protein